jgi:hypothetical protein
MGKNRIRISEADLPAIEVIKTPPEFLRKDYLERLERLAGMAQEEKLDFLLVYGDTHQFANINYLTGITITFEEALLIIPVQSCCNPFFISGNEMSEFYKSSLLKNINFLLFQPFSLQDQPCHESNNLRSILIETGIKKSDKVGIIGNKFNRIFKDYKKIFDIPYFIIETLNGLCGFENLYNVTEYMTDSNRGLKNNCSVKDIAFFEYSASVNSYGIYNMLKNLYLGISEVQAALNFEYSSELPFFVPFGLKFGYDSLEEISPPRHNSILRPGDKIFTGSAIKGSCVARSGIAVKNIEDLENYFPGIFNDYFLPYFDCIVKWYEKISIGITGGQIYKEIKDFLENPLFGAAYNFGHLASLDEWTSSLFYKNSPEILRSGMSIQCDIFSHSDKYNFDLILEDGFILADGNLRAELKKSYPEIFKRVFKRRDFINNIIGIELSNDILPLSNITSVFNPFFLDLSKILSI